MSRVIDRRMLDLATRAAWRGMGLVEPNPMVGCVIASPSGDVLGVGHHRSFGGPHAEVEALRACVANGNEPRGATAYVTLEPCNHHGKTGPCSHALIEASIARVVYAEPDPGPASRGGAAHLAAHGVAVEHASWHVAGSDASASFRKRIESGLPWIIAKWAQTLDGRAATRTGASQWISNAWSRAAVHRLRSRMDVVLTGIGTVLADDPMLTARRTCVRSVARRVVVDALLQTPTDSRLLRSARDVPVTIVTRREQAESRQAASLRSLGAEVVAPGDAGAARVDLEASLRWLAAAHDATNVLVEAGPGLLGSMLHLVDRAVVYIAPTVFGDADALAAVSGQVTAELQDGTRWSLGRVRRLGDDLEVTYRRT
ncbi:MAG: bifunctional diaminohydroxyphosphoribosylaminopyrimidine deaminase/5-amino-6-(5-phosphoribosylamino)uracil reductase RibD [Planctomycetota bacterium]